MLKEAGLSVSEFTWMNRDGQTPRLTHGPSSHYLQITFGADGYFAKMAFSPGDYRFQEFRVAGNWALMKREVQEWVRYLERELKEPDFWETIADEQILMAELAEVNGEDPPFNSAEQARVKAGLDEIRIFVASTQQFSEGQLEMIEKRLNYLVGASSRMGRKDWLLLATGVLTNIVITAAFTPSTAHELFRFAGTIFRWILEHRPQLLP